MRFRSMNNFTDKLPFISQFEHNPKVLGTNTASCLTSGTIHGIVHEIKGFIQYFTSKSSNLKVFLTGGDSIFLGTELKSGIFVDQNLVLKGLNSLKQLNEIVTKGTTYFSHRAAFYFEAGFARLGVKRFSILIFL